MKRLTALLLACMLLLGTACAGAEETAETPKVVSYDFDLQFHLEADHFPFRERKKAQGYEELLDSLDGRGIGVNFDPANLVMCSDDRPEEALRWLGKYVVHTHAKDGIMIPKRMEDPAFGDAMRAEMRQMLERGRIWYEMPLGEGDVDFDVYLPALAETGFDGWLTIEREVGASPERDIALAADFLRTVCARHGIALA